MAQSLVFYLSAWAAAPVSGAPDGKGPLKAETANARNPNQLESVLRSPPGPIYFNGRPGLSGKLQGA